MPNHIPLISMPNLLPTHLDILNGAFNFDDIFAMSVDIDAQWVKTAYQRGLFPWYSQGQLVLWHSPNPRMVLQTNHFVCSHNLKKRLKQWARQPMLNMHVTVNHAFEQVISACAQIERPYQYGTWITDELKAAYIELHQQNQAISIEVWQNNTLQAGLYGVMIGRMFFGESMFTRITDGSKVALACWIEYLRQHNCTLIDCQQKTKHLIRLGGAPIEREEFFMRSKELMLCEPLDFKYLQTLQLLKYFK